MAQSVNKAILIGRLGKDPEVREANGKKIVSLNLATSETWRDKNSGEKKEKTVWHRVVIFNENIGKVAEQYLSKGSLVYVEGSIENRKYTDKDGAEKNISEIVLQAFNGSLTMLGGKGEGGGGDDKTTAKSSKPKNVSDDFSDEVPF